MLKRVLLIDNDDVSGYIETTLYKWGEGQNVTLEVIHFNPVGREFVRKDGSSEIDFELMLSELTSRFLTGKIDVIGCDYNLHDTNKHLTFTIIEKIREFNKICTVFVYSGAPNKELLRYFSSYGDKPGEQLLRSAMTSNIFAFKNKSAAIPEFIIECVKSPSIEIIVEDLLIKYKNLNFIYGYETFKNESVDTVLIDIRRKTLNGVKYVEEIIRRGVENALEINF